MTESDVVVELWVRHEGAMICVLLDQAGGVDALEEWLGNSHDYQEETYLATLDTICERVSNVRLGKPPYFKQLSDYENPTLFEIHRGSFRLLCYYDNRLIVVVHWDRKKGNLLPKQILKVAHKRAKLVDQAIKEERLKINEYED